MVLVATLLLLNSGHPWSTKKPAWVGATLAGYKLHGDNSLGVFDSRSGYYLFSQNECDGADITVTLTKDRRELDEANFYVPGFSKSKENRMKIRSVTFPNLKTSSGGAIGDTRKQILSLFGKPTSESKDGAQKQFLELHYEWQRAKMSEQVWSATFTIKGGKVIEIWLNRDRNELITGPMD